MTIRYVYLARMPRTIDVTPGARWRRHGRSVLAGLLLAVLLPLLWLVGALALLVLLGAATAIVAGSVARSWWRGRDAGRRRANAVQGR